MDDVSDIKKIVLVVDGDAIQRQEIAVRLEIMDYEVLEAGTAEQALTLAALRRPHVVITEWEISGHAGGVEWLRKIKPHAKKLLLFTDHPQSHSEGSWKEWVHLHLSKRQRSELLNFVRMCLENLGLHDDSAKTESAGAARKELQFLIVEDSPTIRGFIRRTIGKGFPGCIIREAEEGRQAISEMSKKKVDLIITDLQMPGMDGREFLKTLESSPLLSKKPIIILSSNITPDLEAEVSEIPWVRLLPKPSSAEAILEEATDLLHQSDKLGLFKTR